MANARQTGTRFRGGLVCSLGMLALGGLLIGTDRPSLARGQTPPAGFASEQVKVINERIAEKWRANKLTPSPRAGDYEFIRRATLDIIGRIAKPEEITRFLQDPPLTRRALLIDRLLKSEDYGRNWATIWTTWLLTRSGNAEYHEQMHLWLEERFSKENYGFDKLVTELLTATGKNKDNGAVNFILAHLGDPTPPDKVAEEGQFSMVPITSRTTRLFLGLQTQCVQCHDHPFNGEWKQKHFWGVNAFFRQVERKGMPARVVRNAPPATLELTDNPNWNVEEDGKAGLIFYERRNGVLMSTRPQFRLPTDKDRDKSETPHPTGTRRQQLAEYIVHNDYFAKAFINRMWFHFFGHGMNSPGAFDDLSGENQITHPELLEYLAKEFRAYGHNPRELIRWICNSEAYNLSSVANSTNDKADAEPFFSRMLLKSMSPEQLFQSLMVATNMDVTMTNAERKQAEKDWMKKLVVNFGDDEGNEATFNGTVVQALILMNGKEINHAVTNDKGLVANLVRKKKTGSMTREIYLAVLNRLPTPRESESIRSSMNRFRVLDKDPMAPWQDLEWALINSNEFILNH